MQRYCRKLWRICFERHDQEVRSLFAAIEAHAQDYVLTKGNFCCDDLERRHEGKSPLLVVTDELIKCGGVLHYIRSGQHDEYCQHDALTSFLTVCMPNLQAKTLRNMAAILPPSCCVFPPPRQTASVIANFELCPYRVGITNANCSSFCV